MKQIIKNTEPTSLVKHRATPHASYENLGKDDVRSSLLIEQGYLCCYCMKRIPESNSIPGCKIEHFKCQNKYKADELNYNNLLASCLGNEGSSKRLMTCDSFKGNEDLTINPVGGRNIEDLIKYKANGEIYSTDKAVNEELENILNLNIKTLVDNRRVVYEFVQNRIIHEVKKKGNNTLKKSFLEKEKNKLLTLNKGKYQEYCMVGVYIINKKLKKIIA